MAKPSTQGLLKQILSDDIDSVYYRITDKAVEWTVAGFVDEANTLLEQLWKFNIRHSENVWVPDEGFQVIWEISGKKPSAIPFEFKDISLIEEKNWFDVFVAYDDDLREPSDILEDLKKFVKTDEAVGYAYFSATCRGALIAAKNNLDHEAEYFIKLWGQGYAEYWANYLLPYLMRDRKTAELLLQGILAPVFNLTKEQCNQETKEIIEALSTRMVKGKTLAYGGLSWYELLDKISHLAIEQETTYFSDYVLENKSLAKPPATEAAIKAVENKLNIAFHADYRTFLLTSNGFECFSPSTGVAICPVEKVDFLRNFNQAMVDDWAEGSMSEIDSSFSDKLRSSIIIGGLEEEQQLLLIPLPDEKWECWHFSNWNPGEEVYESFRFYMEKELQYLEDKFYED